MSFVKDAPKEESNCAICCEATPVSSLILLSTCSHKSCKGCIVKWIEHVEATGRETLPLCPFCRVEMSNKDVFSILGRPFQPRLVTNTPQETDEDVDELTLQLLEEETRQCPSCGARIQKIEGGCDLMECLCGCRFCYGCGQQGAQCSCTPSHHCFWDNVLDRQSIGPAPAEARRDEGTGHADLRNHIIGRKVQDSRAQMRQTVEWEQKSVDEFFLAAKWLFCSKKESGFRVLDELGHREKVRKLREANARTRYQEDLEIDETSFMSACWLFLPNKSTSYKVLDHQLQAGRVRQRRKIRAMGLLRENTIGSELFMSARWLFCAKKKETALQMLKHQQTADHIHRSRKRAAQRRRLEETRANAIDLILRSGSWLFTKKPSRNLSMLLKHRNCIQCSTSRQTYLKLLERIQPDNDAKDNAMIIRLLFLTDEEKAMERKEIAKYGL